MKIKWHQIVKCVRLRVGNPHTIARNLSIPDKKRFVTTAGAFEQGLFLLIL
jgi:hypothetical protein